MSESDPPLLGVGAVIVERDHILLVQRGRDPGKGLWAVPGGKVDRGESLRIAVRREVAEETGLEVEVGEVAWVGELIDDANHIVLIDFHATVIGGDLAAADDADDVAWVPLESASSIALTDTMHDLLDTLRT